MNRPTPLIWLALIMIFLLPTAAGRFLIDLAGGFILILLTIPVLIGGAGWLGWRFLQSRLIKCEVCGASILNSSEQCPICASNITSQQKPNNEVSKFKTNTSSIPASSATIDITAKDAD